MVTSFNIECCASCGGLHPSLKSKYIENQPICICENFDFGVANLLKSLNEDFKQKPNKNNKKIIQPKFNALGKIKNSKFNWK